jgi:hypothetical protein
VISSCDPEMSVMSDSKQGFPARRDGRYVSSGCKMDRAHRPVLFTLPHSYSKQADNLVIDATMHFIPCPGQPYLVRHHPDHGHQRTDLPGQRLLDWG